MKTTILVSLAAFATVHGFGGYTPEVNPLQFTAIPCASTNSYECQPEMDPYSYYIPPNESYDNGAYGVWFGAETAAGEECMTFQQDWYFGDRARVELWADAGYEYAMTRRGSFSVTVMLGMTDLCDYAETTGGDWEGLGNANDSGHDNSEVYGIWEKDYVAFYLSVNGMNEGAFAEGFSIEVEIPSQCRRDVSFYMSCEQAYVRSEPVAGDTNQDPVSEMRPIA